MLSEDFYSPLYIYMWWFLSHGRRLSMFLHIRGNIYIPLFVYYMVVVHEGNVVTVEGRIMHELKVSASSKATVVGPCKVCVI